MNDKHTLLFSIIRIYTYCGPKRICRHFSQGRGNIKLSISISFAYVQIKLFIRFFNEMYEEFVIGLVYYIYKGETEFKIVQIKCKMSWACSIIN